MLLEISCDFYYQEWVPIFEASKGAFYKQHDKCSFSEVEEIDLHSPSQRNGNINKAPSPVQLNRKSSSSAMTSEVNVLLVDKKTFCESFPYHVVFDKHMVIRQGGNKLKLFCSDCDIENTPMAELFDLVHPEIVLTCENIKKFQEVIFMLNLKVERMRRNSLNLSICFRGKPTYIN